jgi:hypothetical protein
VNPDFRLRLRFLEEVFQEIFSISTTMNKALAGFALVALSLVLR